MKSLDELANEYQNKGCIEGVLMFENARTRWAATDFKAGYPACQAEMEKREVVYDDFLTWCVAGVSGMFCTGDDVVEMLEAKAIAARQALAQIGKVGE